MEGPRNGQRGGQEYVITSNVVGAAFNHLAARPADDVRLPDPQLHTHVVLLNMTRRPDGEWRSLDPMQIFGAQDLGSAVYRTELSREVQRLGYRIQVTAANGAWELESYTREQVMAFSARRQQILERLAEQGLSGPKAAQIVALGTRQAKRDYDEAEMKADWERRAHDYGIDARAHFWEALGRGDQNPELTQAISEDALNFARAHTTNRDALVDRRDIEAAALQHGMGKIDLAAVRRQIGIQEAAFSLIRAGKPTPRHPQGAFTTDEMLALERENVALMRARLEAHANAVADREEVQRWAEAKGLSAEQIAAAQLALSSDKGIAAIEGFAGAAKTTTVGAIREFAESYGYTVRGFGMTSGSVKALREAGIEARTLASLLANPLPYPNGAELWFVDESSLVATMKANQTLKAAAELGIGRFILVGDQGQHQGIEAGAPMRQFLAEGMPVAILQDIRRQQDPQLRTAVRIARNDGRSAFDFLREQGRITEISDVDKRYRQIAADYLAGHEAFQNTLVVSPGNDERQALNAEIRKLLVERGHIEKHGQKHQILVRRDFTPAQITNAGSYQEGDVIHCAGTRVQQRQRIRRDSYLTVEAVNRSAKTLIVRAEDGRRLEACPFKWNDTDHVAAEVYKPENRKLAVGDRLQFRHPDNRRNIANGEFAVVSAIGAGEATLRFHGKQNRELTLPLSAMRHVDYGYTVTSFSSQGSTVDRVIVNDDSMRSSRLVNREQLYVSISRGRLDARVYTNDAEALRLAVTRDPKKEIALDSVKQRPTRPLEQQRETVKLAIRI
jgi:hypothetical protein